MQDVETIRKLAVGSYSPSEVQRLAGVPVTLTRRFLSKFKGDLGLWGGALGHDQHLDGRWYATFQDLLELRCLRAFHDAGVSWQRIRRTATYSRDRFSTDYPFSHRRFLTEGKAFSHALEKDWSNFQATVNLLLRRLLARSFSTPWSTTNLTCLQGGTQL